MVKARTWPTLLVESSYKILSLNTAAQELLALKEDWSEGPDNELRHRDNAVTAELQSHIRLLVSDETPSGLRDAYFIDQKDDQQILVALTRIENCLKPCGALCDGGHAVLVTLHDSHHRETEQSTKLLCEVFSLTPAEVRVAFALLDGMSLQAFSKSAGVKISTVRWHLSNALAKTNCSNQRDLVRLLVSLIDH